MMRFWHHNLIILFMLFSASAARYHVVQSESCSIAQNREPASTSDSRIFSHFSHIFPPGLDEDHRSYMHKSKRFFLFIDVGLMQSMLPGAYLFTSCWKKILQRLYE